MPPQLPFVLYNPALLPPDVLLAEFTARRRMLNTMLDIIRHNNSGEPLQHALLIGARGMGKTTTLWAIAHTIKRDPDLCRQWQPVVFDEESRRVGDLADFWLEAIRQWEYATNDQTNRVGVLLDGPSVGIEDSARNDFLRMVERSGRRALLLIDNLDELLSSIRDPVPLHRLRAFLMEDSSVMIIGGATRRFPQIDSIDKPFLDFFRVFDLQPLTPDEMIECLRALARENPPVLKTLEEHPGTVKALHLLTGGNPRLVKTFYRLLDEGLQGDIRVELERLLDEYTPYFKAIVDALPAQQQKIFDAIALAWDPVEVSTLAHATRLPSNQISAALRPLLKGGLVVEFAGRPKRKSYLLADRFSNIHYMMRHGRAARNRLDWFVAFVRLIFPDTGHEVLAKIAQQSAECGLDGIRDAHDLIECALNRATDDDSRRHLVNAAIRQHWDNDTLPRLLKWFDVNKASQYAPHEFGIVFFFQQLPSELRKKLGYELDDALWWHSVARVLEKDNVLDFAEAAYRKAIEIDPKGAYLWYNLGRLFHVHLGRYKDAETAYRKAIEIDPILPYPWNNLGNLLSEQLGRYEEAETAYRKAIEICPKLAHPWNNLGNLLQEHSDRYVEAEEAYRNAVEIDPEFAQPWCGLAKVLKEKSNGVAEARLCATRGLVLKPEYLFAQYIFCSICARQSDAWIDVLPSLATWCASNPKATDVFDFTVEGFLALACLTSPAEALALLPKADSDPFETLRDAFVAHGDRNHLDRLAPERKVVALELIRRMSPDKSKI